jgi:hypothetical protein
LRSALMNSIDCMIFTFGPITPVSASTMDGARTMSRNNAEILCGKWDAQVASQDVRIGPIHRFATVDRTTLAAAGQAKAEHDDPAGSVARPCAYLLWLGSSADDCLGPARRTLDLLVALVDDSAARHGTAGSAAAGTAGCADSTAQGLVELAATPGRGYPTRGDVRCVARLWVMFCIYRPDTSVQDHPCIKRYTSRLRRGDLRSPV